MEVCKQHANSIFICFCSVSYCVNGLIIIATTISVSFICLNEDTVS